MVKRQISNASLWSSEALLILGDNYNMTDVSISHGTISDTLNLRDEVLGWINNKVANDERDGTMHFIVKNSEGLVIGCVSLCNEPFTTYGKNHGVRFFGFAIAPEYQNQGIGSLLLNTVKTHAEKTGETIMWADARESATSFYIRNNFVVSMKPFIEPNNKLVCYIVFKNLRTI